MFAPRAAAGTAARPTAFYHLPPERVVEIGIQVEI